MSFELPKLPLSLEEITPARMKEMAPEGVKYASHQPIAVSAFFYLLIKVNCIKKDPTTFLESVEISPETYKMFRKIDGADMGRALEKIAKQINSFPQESKEMAYQWLEQKTRTPSYYLTSKNEAERANSVIEKENAEVKRFLGVDKDWNPKTFPKIAVRSTTFIQKCSLVSAPRAPLFDFNASKQQAPSEYSRLNRDR